MENSTNSSYENELVIELMYLQSAVTADCRRGSTLVLAGFLVVGILLIIPAIMQTAAAYLWVGQSQRQYGPTKSRNYGSKSGGPQNGRNRRLTEMTRGLFLYRLLACCASLLVLIFSTLPQLVFVVANSPEGRNTDRLWGWCHSLVYFDHATRCFATYLIVVPFAIFFWDFFVSEVIKQQNLVMKQIFHRILISSIPIALFSLTATVPLLFYRYEKYSDGDDVLCNPLPEGTIHFLLFDFAVTRVLPALIIITFGCGFLVWLPRRDYGIFYEPMIFLLLMIPVVLMEITIYISFHTGRIHLLINEHFANILHVSYTVYNMSFSSTFVLATLRSVVAEIREERQMRARFLLGETPKAGDRWNKRRNNVIEGLQRQFSVAFRWRSECPEDELHLGEELKSYKGSLEVSKCEEGAAEDPMELQEKQTDDVTMHYSILRRSATVKSFQGQQSGVSQPTTKKTAKPAPGEAIARITSQLALGEQSPGVQKLHRNDNGSSRHRTTSHGTPKLPRQSREIVNRMGVAPKQGSSADQYLLPTSPRSVRREVSRESPYY